LVALTMIMNRIGYSLFVGGFKHSFRCEH
jgi:hypothetical protein